MTPSSKTIRSSALSVSTSMSRRRACSVTHSRSAPSPEPSDQSMAPIDMTSMDSPSDRIVVVRQSRMLV